MSRSKKKRPPPLRNHALHLQCSLVQEDQEDQAGPGRTRGPGRSGGTRRTRGPGGSGWTRRIRLDQEDQETTWRSPPAEGQRLWPLLLRSRCRGTLLTRITPDIPYKRTCAHEYKLTFTRGDYHCNKALLAGLASPQRLT